MLNRKLIALLALLLSAGLSLSACGGDDDDSATDNNQPVGEGDAGDNGDNGDDGDGDATGDSDDDGSGDDTNTGCTNDDECADGFDCNVDDAVCVPSVTGCDLTGDDRPERCDEITSEFGPASRVTEFAIAPNTCCFDMDGSGTPNNELSFLTSLGVNDGIQGSVDTGSLVLLFEHEGLTDTVDSDLYTLNVWLGESVPTEEGETVEGPFAIDANSVDQGSFPQAYLPNAQITGGVMTAGPGVIDLDLTLPGILDAPLALRISQAQIEAIVDPSSSVEGGVAINHENPALTGGKLGGAIRVDDLVGAINNVTTGSCDCLGLEGADYIELDGNNMACVETPDAACGADDNSLCTNLAQVCDLLPMFSTFIDVDTDGDGEADALSIGMTFDAEAAEISGIGTP